MSFCFSRAPVFLRIYTLSNWSPAPVTHRRSRAADEYPDFSSSAPPHAPQRRRGHEDAGRAGGGRRRGARVRGPPGEHVPASVRGRAGRRPGPAAARAPAPAAVPAADPGAAHAHRGRRQHVPAARQQHRRRGQAGAAAQAPGQRRHPAPTGTPVDPGLRRPGAAAAPAGPQVHGRLQQRVAGLVRLVLRARPAVLLPGLDLLPAAVRPPRPAGVLRLPTAAARRPQAVLALRLPAVLLGLLRRRPPPGRLLLVGGPQRRPADRHPEVCQREQRRRQLLLQLRDRERHRGPGAGRAEAAVRRAAAGRGRGRRGRQHRPGRLRLHGPGQQPALLPHLHRRRERLPGVRRAPAHAAAHPRGHPALHRVQRARRATATAAAGGWLPLPAGTAGQRLPLPAAGPAGAAPGHRATGLPTAGPAVLPAPAQPAAGLPTVGGPAADGRRLQRGLPVLGGRWCGTTDSATAAPAASSLPQDVLKPPTRRPQDVRKTFAAARCTKHRQGTGCTRLK